MLLNVIFGEKMYQEETFPPINKIQMRAALDNVGELYEVLKKWKNKYPKAFRLDGHHSIGPANPAQWIFFKVEGLKPENFKGLELGKAVDGTKWNGVYYLTASTRMESIIHFINLYEKHNGDASKIFSPSYTDNKAGIPSKRKLYLNEVNSNEEVNTGWFCKQYYDRFNPNR